jgi:hypothetical protein
MTLFPGWRRERLISRVLKQLARSRVVGIVQPNNVWIVENALISDSEEIEAALRTCYMRGWIDLLEEKVLHGSPLPDGSLPTDLEAHRQQMGRNSAEPSIQSSRHLPYRYNHNSHNLPGAVAVKRIMHFKPHSNAGGLCIISRPLKQITS